jgi:hypothetical protein
VTHPRRVWGLLGHRSGDNQQVVALCEALGWPFEIKQLRYGWTSRTPNVLRGTRPLGVAVEPSTPLGPPWPDLVVAVGRRSVALALQLRAASQGRCRLVQLGRPRAPLHWFDLVISTPQYRIPPHPNLLEIPLPLARTPGAPDPLVALEIAALPRPRTAVLVGGPTAELRFGAVEARDLAARLEHLADRQGGSFMLTTSPRTPPVVAEEMRRRLREPRRIHEWTAAAANPYVTFLATADTVIVTGDSISMTADACRTGVPVGVYRLPQRRTPVRRASAALYAWLARRVDRQDLPSRLLFSLVDAGLVVSPRAYDAVHRVLEQRGIITYLPGDFPAAASTEWQRSEIAAWERSVIDRVKSLFGDARA